MAGGEMVIDQARGLHEGIHRGRADEAKATTAKFGAECG